MPRVEVVPGAEGQPTEKVNPERTVAHWDLQLLMAVVTRGGGEAETARITLGRAAENDLVVSDVRVSKTQTWLDRSSDGEWLVGDAGSTNGTRVDGSAVPRTHGVRIRSGARIRVAESLDLMFLEPEALWGIIERVRAAQETIERERSD